MSVDILVVATGPGRKGGAFGIHRVEARMLLTACPAYKSPPKQSVTQPQTSKVGA